MLHKCFFWKKQKQGKITQLLHITLDDERNDFEQPTQKKYGKRVHPKAPNRKLADTE